MELSASCESLPEFPPRFQENKAVMVRFRRCRRSVLGLVAATGLSLGCPPPEAMAAVDIALVSGGFRRSIPVKEIEHLAETGEPIGLLDDLLAISGQKPEDVAKLLNQKLNFHCVDQPADQHPNRRCHRATCCKDHLSDLSHHLKSASPPSAPASSMDCRRTAA